MRSFIAPFKHQALSILLTVGALLSPLLASAQMTSQKVAPSSWPSILESPAANQGVDLNVLSKPKDSSSDKSEIHNEALKKALLETLGTKDGGGGDEVALDFKATTTAALQDFQQFLPDISNQLKQQSLEALAQNAKVLVVDDALDVQIKNLVQNSVALNIPSMQLILINRQRWTLIANTDLKKAIALHELLSLRYLESTGSYPISTQFLASLSQQNGRHTKPDVGVIQTLAYTCSTSPNNMIGLGQEFQILLQQGASKIISSQISRGNVSGQMIHIEMARTWQTDPAQVTRQSARYFIRSRLHTVESSEVKELNFILDTRTRVLDVLFEDGRSLPISCVLMSRF